MTRPTIMVVTEEPVWRNSGVDPARVRAAARLALARGHDRKKAASPAAKGLTILLADDARLRELNGRFRGKDSPTNVLSFPSSTRVNGYLGDVAIGFGVAVREARSGRKPLADHVLHLTVHGVLHLLGYDHEKPGDARIMERLEIAVLRELGIADPYLLPA